MAAVNNAQFRRRLYNLKGVSVTSYIVCNMYGYIVLSSAIYHGSEALANLLSHYPYQQWAILI